MNYTSKTNGNQQLSNLFICFSIPSKNLEPIKFKSLPPQRQDFILDTTDLSCEIQITLFELLRCESSNGSEKTPGCALSVTERQISKLGTSEIIEWTVGPETDRRFLVWWAFNRPFLVSQTLFKDDYGLDLIVVVSGYTVDAEASRDG